MEAALTIDGLSRRCGDRVVLSDLSLTVAPGERVAFRGANCSARCSLLTRNNRPNAVDEPRLRERRSMRLDRVRIPPTCDERRHRLRDRGRIRAVEEQARHVGDDRVEVAAPAEGSDGLSQYRRLHGGEAEVLPRGCHEPGAVRVEPAQRRVVHLTEKPHVLGCAGDEAGALRSVADDDERQPRQPAERLHHLLDVLVRQQPSDREHVAGLEPRHRLAGPVDGEPGRREEHLRLDPVHGTDLRRDERRVRDVHVRARGGTPVEAAQHGIERAQPDACGRRRAVAQVVAAPVEPLRRRVAVDDLAALGPDAVRPAARAAHDDVCVARAPSRTRAAGRGARGGGAGGAVRRGRARAAARPGRGTPGRSSPGRRTTRRQVHLGTPGRATARRARLRPVGSGSRARSQRGYRFRRSRRQIRRPAGRPRGSA